MPAATGHGDDAALLGVARRRPSANARQRRLAGGARSLGGARRSTSIRSPPMRALSSAGEPAATTRPWSSTTIVVGEPVGLLEVLGGEQRPSCRRGRARAAAPTARCGSAGRGRSSARRGTGRAGAATSVAARSSRRRMPPEKVLTSRSASSARSSRSSSSSARRRALGARQVVEAPDELEVRAGGQQAVDGRRLGRRGRCARADLGGVGDDVEPATRALPVVGRASVVRMRTAVVLPAPLWPSRPRTGAGGDVEVQVAQRPQVAVALAEALGDDRRCSYDVRLYFVRSYVRST